MYFNVCSFELAVEQDDTPVTLATWTEDDGTRMVIIFRWRIYMTLIHRSDE